ncbi:MAG: hypothetical protein JWL81_1789 [Verrucomicrobiales bacterium]|nr:hypothetical protein [Verrucomicrobiales bacterium]
MRLPSSSILRILSALALAASACLWPGSVPVAQAQALKETLYTAGTVTKNAANQHWAYLSFQIDEPAKLMDRKLAVYVKPGGPASPAAFVRKAVVTVQTEPLILQTLITRAANLGESAAELEFALNEIFGDLVPDPSLSLAKKLSGVIQGALPDPQQYGSLVLLSRTHPAVAMALGLSYGEAIGTGESTFEVREFDVVAGADLGVVGRVTVMAGQPVVLPAPGPPVEVPDASAKGHLNARLRWGTPIPLRRLSLLHFGYNIYRIPRAWAEASGLHQTPPEAAVLAGMAEQGLNGIRRINGAPALAARVMTELEAGHLEADPKTAFINDDNGLAQDDAVPFKDGEQFYYFGTARDLLGRDGLVSPGTLVTMTDRVPPSAPRGVVVENDYRTNQLNQPVQRLRVTWKQRPPEADNNVIGYYVHRWDSPGEVSLQGGDPLFKRISPLIPHLPGQATQTFLDETPGAPVPATHADKTVYYTVRAVEQVSTGQNLSGNSAPAGGVLRDREAPAGPGGGMFINCTSPLTRPDGTEDSRLPGADDAEAVIDLVCTRDSPSIQFADFNLGGTGVAQLLARVHFQPGVDTVRKRVVLRRNGAALPVLVFCRTGVSSSHVSAYAQQTLSNLPPQDFRRRVIFRGLLQSSEVLWTDAAEANGCEGHEPHPGPQGGDGTPGNETQGLKIKVDLTPTTKEWRLYRRIDAGKMSMLRQGLADFTSVQQIEVVDTDLPASAGTIFYFGQLLDQNGNASQLALLGKAVPLKQKPPTPMQAPVALGGTPGSPSATVKWFCPAQGVERFEVLVHVAPGSAPAVLTPVLGSNHHTPMDQFALGPVDEDATPTLTYGAYYTPQVGGALGSGPDFQFSFPMAKDKTYLIQIAAISKNGGKRSIGNVQRLKWKGGQSLSGVPAPGTPNVPWPEILPPAPEDAWSSAMVPVQINAGGFNGVGIRIGELKQDQLLGGDIRGHGSLSSALYPPSVPNASGDQLLPVVVYRYQVPSTRFPQVSGDLIQVTPLMEKIALHRKSSNGTAYSTIEDPFIRVVTQSVPFIGAGIYLVDTQPVMKRASYAYVVVRFGRNGEIASVHPLPEINIF